MKQYILIANWKMNVRIHQAKQLITIFQTYALNQPLIACIICPSFDLLYALHPFPSSLLLGAQDCSMFEQGNFTGDVSAINLHDSGCTFCIVGHSERRNYHHETNIHIEQKLNQLLKANITPILCVGETEKDKNRKKEVIKQQLGVLEKYTGNLYIAYEPQWAIGTNELPSNQEIQKSYDIISYYMQKSYNHIEWKFIYGGNVSSSTLPSLLSVPCIDGFLVGRAFTDLQQIKSMIEHILQLHDHN